VHAAEGQTFPQQEIKVSLSTGKKGDSPLTLGATRDNDRAMSFKLPRDMHTGNYLVSVVIGSNPPEPVPGHLRVLEDEAAKVTLDAIQPAVLIKSQDHDGFDFDLAGQNLARLPDDNIVEADTVPQPVGDKTECKGYADKRHYDEICLSYDHGMETRRLKVRGFHPVPNKTSQEIMVQVGNNVSNGLTATFAAITPQGARVGAVVIFAVLALAALALVWKGIGDYKIAGQAYSPLASFLLDKETNSFSLSKFQLVAWTTVVIFGYVYLFLCQLFIQGIFVFPPIPDGLPSLLGISVGTTVAASGITSARGSKGAGPVQPSMADFISTGGLVAGDRFQLFVWTLVGGLGFLGLLLKTDPTVLKELPKVPDNFLYLMGISSAGYLGGKLVRLPGPVIKLLSVTEATDPTPQVPSRMTFNLKGENLSRRAGIKVDDQTMRDGQYSINPLQPQNQPPDPSFFNEIELTVNDATKYLEGTHTLTLTNPDGQSASFEFPMDRLTIEKVDDVPHGAAADATANVVVTGKNFKEHTRALWKDGGATPEAPVAEAQVVRTSDTQLTVTLRPGTTQGEGKLTLISQVGLRASAKVRVT
jgi:hypothetical protein